MKSLEARKAERAQREADAKKSAQASREVLATGTMAEGRVAGSEEEEEEGSYGTWTVPDLKNELDGRKIEYASNTKKADLIKLLEENDEAGE